MNHKLPFGQFGIGNIVYVKAVAIDDLPDSIQDEAREQADGADTLYAVHREDGEQLALVVDRDLAYALARQNDFSPVSIH
ncbi:hypothetical protein GCM10016455_07980 [Aliiroseovarius zhejiangensis]|uniref:DUF1150 domain-containing protein n=1 Tax=Aliiroseovarius zhejiangensis TaxID=1632025 RepID=A0ABQ3IRC9_9RHOB|nr:MULTISPECIES: DUF1150 family protein [Aliiroseovarius]MCK8482813.1 DUF1150 domain-containing protein [Aliiroseovarius sp. S2029]GHE90055.1 hypothetical protein GCM10016455_07980 [Aliiroseovarius zhejiangensis]